MDFLDGHEGSAPAITAAMHLDLTLERAGLTRDSLGAPENVLLILTPPDVRAIRRLLDLATAERYPVGGASFYRVKDHQGRFGVAGPAVGAPVAAMVLESLAALGVKRVIAFGWCGSLQERLAVGSLVVPRSAIREEGTSYHYLRAGLVPEVSQGLADLVVAKCEAAGRRASEGVVWTTDALYREARSKVAAFRGQGVLGVDMETSAIFAVGAHLGIETAALLLVSDEIGGAEWRVGLRDEAFRPAHEAACQIAVAACAAL